MIKPAIAAVGCNRPYSLKRLLKSIGEASYPFDDITLIISIDRSNLSSECEDIARAFNWEHGTKEIRHFREKQGLRKHIIQCGDLSEKYGAVIVLEDDLFVSQSFYHYVYSAVNYYNNCSWTAGVSLYSHEWNGYNAMPFVPENNGFDVYLGQFSISWGQCWTWKQWQRFREWYNINEGRLPKHDNSMPEDILSWGDNSWGMYYVYFLVHEDLYYVMPYNAMSTNFSEPGQHTRTTDSVHQVSIVNGVKTDYNFAGFDEAVKYDVFFERIFDSRTIIGSVKGDEVCVDLYSLKKEALGKNYILTDRKLNLPVIKTFGIRMRPIEANVTHEIEGNDIFLYKASDPHMSLPVFRDITPARRRLEFYGYSCRILQSEALRRISLKSFIKRIIKKLLPFIK